jgi:glycosyltransferase involved in cell wall biosynthesis
MWPTPDAPMAGIFVAEQVGSLRRRGIPVDVLFVNGAAGRTRYLTGIPGVRRAVVSGVYDLIHAHYVFSGVMVLAAQAVRPGRRLPIVLTQHGIEAQVGWTAPLCRWTSRRVTATIATSARVRDALAAGGRQSPAVEIIPCGVDTNLFRPLPRSEARAALGLPVNAPLVLFAGVRRPEKRFELVAAAVKVAAEGCPEIELVVAEHEPHQRMPLFMSACDVLVLASQAEGSPMVVKEALACNLPVVSVDVGDVAERIGGVEGCFVVGRQMEADPGPVAQPLASELADGILRALAFGRRTEGRAAIMPLSLDAVAARLEAVYREVVG